MTKKDDIVKIYDDMFNLIGAEKWSIVHQKGLFHQVVHLWMYGDEDDGRWLYFIQRSKELDVFPGLYDLPVSGHIDPDETFSQAVVTLTKERLDLDLKPELLRHVGNIRQKIDHDNYHDNAFCQVYVKKIELPIPDFKIQGVEMLFKAKYHDYCRWVKHPEGTIAIYTPNGEYIKDATVDEWWWLRKEEFTTIVKPYIDEQ